MRVLVCGGRDFDNTPMLCKALNKLNNKHGIELIINGACEGADTASCGWAVSAGIPFCMMPAHWKQLGRSAGPKRNKWMLDLLAPDAVVAFPGGRGTEGMVKMARDHGLKVWEVGKGGS